MQLSSVLLDFFFSSDPGLQAIDPDRWQQREQASFTDLGPLQQQPRCDLPLGGTASTSSRLDSDEARIALAVPVTSRTV